jgi:hypothetical protein
MKFNFILHVLQRIHFAKHKSKTVARKEGVVVDKKRSHEEMLDGKIEVDEEN